MSNLAANVLEEIGDVSRLALLTAARHDSGFDLRTARPKLISRAERYGHLPAVVLSRSWMVRSSLEQALFARGAAVVNLRTLPSPGHTQDLLASGLILLAPPNHRQKPDGSEWIEAADVASTKECVNGILLELERRGLLRSREVVSPGEGI